jgi:hypothetical protein
MLESVRQRGGAPYRCRHIFEYIEERERERDPERDPEREIPRERIISTIAGTDPIISMVCSSVIGAVV